MSALRSLAPALLALAGLSGCTGLLTEKGYVHLPRLPEQRAQPLSTAVAVCPLVDARPVALTESHTPVRVGGWNVMVGGGGFLCKLGQDKHSGARMYGDNTVQYVPDGTSDGGGPEVLEGQLASVLSRLTGVTNVRRGCSSFTLDDVDRAAAGASGPTLVAIPVLDQLGMAGLESSSVFSTSASYTDRYHYRDYTDVSTSGRRETTKTFTNARLRLVLLRTDGGRVLSRQTVYGTGAVEGRSSFSEVEAAVAQAFDQLAVGLGEVLEPPSQVASAQ